MELFVRTFNSVATLLLIGVVGFWLISRRIVPGEILRFLSRLALEVALPCLIFVNVVARFDPAQHPRWWVLPLWWAGFTACVVLLSLVFSRLSRRKTRGEFALALCFQNAIFFPVAVISQMFGTDSPFLVDLFFFTLFFAGFVFNTYPLFLGGGLKGMDWRKALHPVFIATVLAIVVRVTGLHAYVPQFALAGLGMLGQMAVPLLMLILGGNIYVDFRRKGSVQPWEVAKFVALKNFVFPLIALAILLVIRPAYNIALIVLLQSAMPPITSVPVLVERQGGDRSIASQFVVASFVCSLISIPLMVWLFGRLFALPSSPW